MTMDQSPTGALSSLRRCVGRLVWPAFVALALASCGPRPDANNTLQADANAAATSTAAAVLAPYTATPAHEQRLHEFDRNVLRFVLLHETGHMVFHEFDVDVLGHEEDAADGFAAYMLTGAPSADQNGGKAALADAAAFWRMVGQDGPSVRDWTDEHGQPEQRATWIACALYATDPQGQGEVAKKYGVTDRAGCLSDVQHEMAEFGKVLDSAQHADTAAGNSFDSPAVGYGYASPPGPSVSVIDQTTRDALNSGWSIVTNDQTMLFVARQLKKFRIGPHAHGQQPRSPLAELVNAPVLADPFQDQVDSNRHVPQPLLLTPIEADLQATLTSFDYLVVGSSCLRSDGGAIVNAMWDTGTQHLVLCYGLADYIDKVGRRVVMSEDQSQPGP
jgi:Putative metallopeptidase